MYLLSPLAHIHVSGFRQSRPASAQDLLAETALVKVSDRPPVTRFGGHLSVYLSLHQPGASRHLPVPPAFTDNCLNLSIDFPASRPLVLPSLGVSPYYLPEIFLPGFWLLTVSAPAAAKSLSCV